MEIVSLEEINYEEIEITSIKSGRRKTVDIEVDDVHHYILDNGIVSHNSSIICDLISNGVEPIFSLEYQRKKIVDKWPDGLTSENIKDVLKQVKEKDYEYWQGEYNGKRYYYEPHNRGLCEITDVRDYGYNWILQNYPKEKKAKYVVTAQTLKVKDHLDIQELAQFYCNQSISKCVAKGTLIATDKGILKIEDIGEKKVADSFSDPKEDYKVLDENGDLKKITSHYYGGIKKVRKITFDNGYELVAANTHKLKTQDGYIRVDRLNIGEKVIFRKNAIDNKNEYIEVPQPKHKNNGITRKFPKVCDEDFALYLGMFLADGSSNKNGISIVEKDDNVFYEVTRLHKKLFDISKNPSLDKRTGVRSHVINSRGLSSWFKENLGNNCLDKDVPDFIMKSSNEVKIAFITGLTLDGYKNKRGLTIYEGYSKKICDKTASILASLGIRYHIGSKYVKNGLLSKESFGITAFLEDNDLIVPIEEHKRDYITEEEKTGFYSKQSLLFNGEEILKGIKEVKYKTDIYNKFNRLRRSLKKDNWVSTSLMDSLEIRYDKDIIPVIIKEISEEFEEEVYDIEVEDTHSYLLNGIISHNTVNVPAKYSFEDFKQLYIEGWERGLNGLTTYVEGSMEDVLSTIDKAKETKGIIKRDIKLPSNFENGHMEVIRREGMKFYMHFSYLPEDSKHEFPIVLWINSNAKGEARACNRACKGLAELALDLGIDSDIVDKVIEKSKDDLPHNKLARMISLCLRHYVPREKILSRLRGIEGDNISSLLTAVRKFLGGTIKDGTKVEGEKCPECGSENLVIQSACTVCADCGNSGCG